MPLKVLMEFFSSLNVPTSTEFSKLVELYGQTSQNLSPVVTEGWGKLSGDRWIVSASASSLQLIAVCCVMSTFRYSLFFRSSCAMRELVWFLGSRLVGSKVSRASRVTDLEESQKTERKKIEDLKMISDASLLNTNLLYASIWTREDYQTGINKAFHHNK